MFSAFFVFVRVRYLTQFCLRQVETLVKEALELCGSECTVVFTGHSLGGGLALLGAVLAAQSSTIPIHVHGFAGPRVGNVDFVKYTSTLSALRSIHRITSKG